MRLWRLVNKMCNAGTEQIKKDIGLYKIVSTEEQKEKLKDEN